MKLTLLNTIEEQPDIISFFFKVHEPFTFIPGQYLRYTLPHDNPDNRGINRFFSISSAPSEAVIRLTTRFAEQSSSFKKALRELSLGTEIEANGPGGAFTYPDVAVPAVFIAGGIGITPFRSMLVELLIKKIDAAITLLYSSRDENFIFRPEFESYAALAPHFSVHFQTGRIEDQLIHQHVHDLTLPVFYLSGPKPMVEGLTQMLISLGVEKEKIKQDFFPGYTEV